MLSCDFNILLCCPNEWILDFRGTISRADDRDSRATQDDQPELSNVWLRLYNHTKILKVRMTSQCDKRNTLQSFFNFIEDKI